jgi:hypothetical protein
VIQPRPMPGESAFPASPKWCTIREKWKISRPRFHRGSSSKEAKQISRSCVKWQGTL